MSPRDVILALLVVIVWGVNFVAIRWGVDEVPPLLLTALRYVLAALPAIFFIRRPQVSLVILVCYGLAIGVLQVGLLTAAIKVGMPAGLSSVVVQTQAFFTLVLAVAFLGERLRLSQIAGALTAMAGIGVIGLERLNGAALLPLLTTLGSAFFWGVANIVTKKAGKIDMVWSALVPPIPMFLASLVFEGPGALQQALADITWTGIGSIAFVAYASTLFGYGAWNLLLSQYPANIVAPFSLLVPVAGVASAALLLGETISAIEVGGSVMVFLGLSLNVFGARLRAGATAWISQRREDETE